MIEYEILDSDAWKAMSHGARSLFGAIKRRYNVKANNNGKIYLSLRKAAGELGSHIEDVGQWFRELKHYGFIVMVRPGHGSVDGQGVAPHWRLTNLDCNGRGRNQGLQDLERRQVYPLPPGLPGQTPRAPRRTPPVRQGGVRQGWSYLDSSLPGHSSKEVREDYIDIGIGIAGGGCWSDDPDEARAQLFRQAEGLLTASSSRWGLQ